MLWQIIKKLDFKQLFGLFGLFLKNPLFAISTFFATKACVEIVYKEFGSRHHLSNRANAFRHALWVVLIIQKSLYWKTDAEKAIKWAIKFTTWHEDFSPNEALERTMDLHNNHMGAIYFEAVKYKKKAE